MVWTPHVTVATVIERDDHFLLVHEYTDQELAVYNQPAGHVEAGETLIEAALRETREETAWQVEITDLLGLYVYTPPHRHDLTYYRVCFIARPLEQLAGLSLDTGIIGAEWIPYTQLASMNNLRSPLVQRCIEDYRAGQRFPLHLIHEHVWQ
ncbi:MAG: NUDIX hydrolase [Pseudomonadales bacterium]|nr:NUDIX hydrolase [Pseudomonadales bacterium]